jgi:hypothetical protein
MVLTTEHYLAMVCASSSAISWMEKFTRGLVMCKKQISVLFLSFPVLVLSLPAHADPLGLAPSDLAFCSEVRDARVREAVASSQRHENIQVNTNFDFGYAGIIGVHGDSQGSGRTVNSSSSSRDMAMSNYQSRNCNTLLQTASQVTVAQIDANARTAIAQMQADTARYNADIQAVIANVNLEAIRDGNSANVQMTGITAAAQVRIEELRQAGRVEEAHLMAETLQRQTAAEQSGRTDRARIEAENLRRMVESSNNAAVQTANINAQTQQLNSNNQLSATRSTNNTSTTNTLLTQSATLLGSLINPPSRSAQIQARTEQQRIAAETERERMRIQLERERMEQERLLATAPTDPIAQLLAQWGWSRIACNSGIPVIAISGMANEAVCVQPTAYVPAGNYSFNPATNQLVPIATATSYPNYSQPSPANYYPQPDPSQGAYDHPYPAVGI